jgi:Leu/Phe-tRNA-protein transferase
MPNQVLLLPNRLPLEWQGFRVPYQRRYARLLHLIDKHGNRETLKRLEVWQAQKTLGVFLAMDGNQRAQFLFLKEAAIIFADQIRSSKCVKNTALYTYNSCFMKSMEYCMTTTNFSETEWNAILAPALKYSLQNQA